MSLDRLIEDWRDLRKRIQHHWSDLRDEDFGALEKGKADLVDLLRRRYGFNRREAHDQIERFTRRMHHSLRATAAQVGATAAGIWRRGSSQVRDGVESGLEHGQELWSKGRRWAEDSYEDVEDFVRKRPWTAVAIGAGVLATISVLLFARRRS